MTENVLSALTERTLLFLSHSDVSRVLPSMSETIAAVREVLLYKDSRSVQMPAKTTLRLSGSAFFHAMPALLRGLREVVGVKWIAAFPSNRGRGLSYLTGLLVLNDPQTGFPLTVMDASWITAQRTAAVSAVAVTLLARTDSRVAAIVGTGMQACSHLQALAMALDDLKEVRVYNPSADSARQFVEEQQSAVPHVKLTPASSAKNAVVGADIVVSVTRHHDQNDAGIQAAWLKPGALGLPIDLANWEALEDSADLLFVDDASEYSRYRSEGRFPTSLQATGELGDVATGRLRGRRAPEDRIVVVAVGLAIYDLAVAALVYDRALAEGVGTTVGL